jgi:hypothetical protein
MLMRIVPVDGSVSTVGPTVAGLASLASAPDGTLYGIGNGTLYRIDSTTGEAAEVAPLPGIPGSAFRKPYSKYLCLDTKLRYERGRPLSRYVVSTNDKVQHVNKCPNEPEVCEICRPRATECGTCGSPGFYRLPKTAQLTFVTPELPVNGTYAVRFQLRGASGTADAKLRITIGSGELQQVFESAPENTSWDFTEPILVPLASGVNRITVRSIGSRAVDLEQVQIERKCPGLCEVPKKNECLDPRFDPASGLSKFVTEVTGDAGHAKSGGCCGSEGYYWVRGADGRIAAKIPVATAGRYLVKFFYRVQARNGEASVRVTVGSSSRLYSNAELVHGNQFQWSASFEAQLGQGTRTFEFLSQLTDRIDIERVSLQLVCECGGPSLE